MVASKPMENLKGTIERITYFNPENGYSVVKIKPDGAVAAGARARDGTVAVVGTMPELSVGETVLFGGSWFNDSRYGTQFKVETVTPVEPNTETGIMNYIGSGLVRGIGPRTAEKIVRHFGADTLKVLDRSPERLVEVKGLNKKKAAELAVAWAENYAGRQAMIYLQGYGVSSRMAAKIYKEYGSETIEKVKENPYTLADDVHGIGFIRADDIALKMNVPEDSPQRIAAGLFYALNQLAKEGHVYSPRARLIRKTAELLQIDETAPIDPILEQQLKDGKLILESVTRGDGMGNAAVYLPEYYQAEANAAWKLRALVSEPSKLAKKAKKLNLSKISSEIRLSEQQQQAVMAALTNKVSVLTGGPGTGKTTTLKMVIESLQALDFTFALACPTGRAAKRLGEATGCTAATLHRLLAFSPKTGEFLYNETHHLEVDMVIVDETSMLDLQLFDALLQALPPQCHLMLVGDVDQLPSVGAGNVLRDVIDSGIAPVTRLNFIFRQEAGSYITVNAHRVNQGEIPYTDNQSRDFFFFNEEDPEAAARMVVDVVTNRLPARFQCDPINDVQVIAPMYRGAAGVSALNEALQKALNNSGRNAEKQIGGRIFRVGDKVMQTRNNYDKDVFNGDIGRISAIDFEEQTFEVVFDEQRYVFYEWMEVEELIHAYCISTHRSQGSEYPIVVMPLLTQHYMMLQRNLLYTAITRAKKVVVLVGTRKAMHLAVQNNQVAERYSGLVGRLKTDLGLF
jgi:exodeoxyribonuclease V alpha subunit